MNMSKRPRAIIHTRVSRDQQAENTSHATQLAAALKKAEELGAEIVKTFQEEVSGALYQARPDIQESLSMVERGEADMLIFAKLDRAGRDVINLRMVRRRIEKAGGQLVFADGLSFLPGAFGDLMFTQLSSWAEYERASIADRMGTGLRSRAASGIQVARSKSPYGYHIPTHNDIVAGRYVPEQLGKYIVVPDKAEIINQIYEKYTSGDSSYSIVEWLYTNGIQSPSGLRKWHVPTITQIIRNPVYKGMGTYGRHRSFVDESRVENGLKVRTYDMRDESEWIIFSTPPIVSPDLWKRANIRLDEARQKHSGRRDRRHALSGLFHCRVCRRKMQSFPNRRAARPHAEGAQYYCKHNLGDPPTCTNERYYSSPTHEVLVNNALIYLLENPDSIENAKNEYLKIQSEKLSGNAVALNTARLEKQLAIIDKKLRIAAEAKIEARMEGNDESAFDAVLSKLSSEREPIVLEIEEYKKMTITDVPTFYIPTNKADLIIDALNSELSGAERHELYSSFCSAIYPVGAQKHQAVEIELHSDDERLKWILRSDKSSVKLTVITV